MGWLMAILAKLLSRWTVDQLVFCQGREVEQPASSNPKLLQTPTLAIIEFASRAS
jgi:hypothetical protein